MTLHRAVVAIDAATGNELWSSQLADGSGYDIEGSGGLMSLGDPAS